MPLDHIRAAARGEQLLEPGARPAALLDAARATITPGTSASTMPVPMREANRFGVYVIDVNDRARILKARAEFFKGDLPASTLVEVSNLVDPRYAVEIETTAALGCDDA